jgi:hypothetical protein
MAERSGILQSGLDALSQRAFFTIRVGAFSGSCSDRRPRAFEAAVAWDKLQLRQAKSGHSFKANTRKSIRPTANHWIRKNFGGL